MKPSCKKFWVKHVIFANSFPYFLIQLWTVTSPLPVYWIMLTKLSDPVDLSLFFSDEEAPAKPREEAHECLHGFLTDAEARNHSEKPRLAQRGDLQGEFSSSYANTPCLTRSYISKVDLHKFNLRDFLVESNHLPPRILAKPGSCWEMRRSLDTRRRQRLCDFSTRRSIPTTSTGRRRERGPAATWAGGSGWSRRRRRGWWATSGCTGRRTTWRQTSSSRGNPRLLPPSTLPQTAQDTPSLATRLSGVWENWSRTQKSHWVIRSQPETEKTQNVHFQPLGVWNAWHEVEHGTFQPWHGKIRYNF